MSQYIFDCRCTGNALKETESFSVAYGGNIRDLAMSFDFTKLQVISVIKEKGLLPKRSMMIGVFIE